MELGELRSSEDVNLKMNGESAATGGASSHMSSARGYPAGSNIRMKWSNIFPYGCRPEIKNMLQLSIPLVGNIKLYNV